MKKNIELLAPVGDFECLKAAVQNGANCVYFGATMFSARASAHNFNLDELKKAIEYAKLRNVKTNLTLNILIKNDEFESAFELAKKAYEYGIDAIIVQDLGLAKLLIDSFPDLAIHASTQLSIHNLEGALKLQEMGFKRIVLSRELSFEDIKYITENVNVEIEAFIHGALCISYSGQCLASSMIGGRSGNRGRCAQTCRLSYELLENENVIDKGFLLSPRDLCGLEYLPKLVKAGVKCLKIEGRLKSPEYVATVTRIYRKYLDLAYLGKDFEISEKDKIDLMQVFNRGAFSEGHLSSKPNKNLIFKEKPNNMGLYLGNVLKFNKDKGYITLKLNQNLAIGDTVSLEKETGSYNVSELMEKSKNIKQANIGETVTIGRMKGNIRVNDKIYKMSSKELFKLAQESFENDVQKKKISLNCDVKIIKGSPISIRVYCDDDDSIYYGLDKKIELDVIPVDSVNRPLSMDKVLEQLNKLNNTQFRFENINIDLEDNLFLPSFSSLNELRRCAIQEAENYGLSKIHRISKIDNFEDVKFSKKIINDKKISLLLNKIDLDFDYSKLEDVNFIYIPLSFFDNPDFEEIIRILAHKADLYIYIPTIIKPFYFKKCKKIIDFAISSFDIKGFVLSNYSNFELLKDLELKNYTLISNYTFNCFNNHSVLELKKLGFNRFTVSPELDRDSVLSLCENEILSNELIVYGNIPIMNMSYCLLGSSNKCYKDCQRKCMSKNVYEIKDRIGMKFRVIPDNSQTVTTIYNSKILSILPSDFNVDVLRIDILDENIQEINEIISTVKAEKRMEGQEYTNGNLNRIV